MQSCVIYNPKTGDVYNIIYNMDTIPEGLEDTAMILDIPNGCNLVSLDVKEQPPKPKYTYWPAIDLESVKQSVSDNKTAINRAADLLNSKADTSLTDILLESLVDLTYDICSLQLEGV